MFKKYICVSVCYFLFLLKSYRQVHGIDTNDETYFFEYFLNKNQMRRRE